MVGTLEISFSFIEIGFIKLNALIGVVGGVLSFLSLYAAFTRIDEGLLELSLLILSMLGLFNLLIPILRP